MDPIKDFLERAWEGLTEGWRELLTRSNGALTRFGAGSATANTQSQGPARWSLLAAETWETAHSVVIRVEIPGINEDDLTVDIEGNVLRIRGEKHTGLEQEVRRYHLVERAYGHFERRIPIPHGVDVGKAEVSYRSGVLVVILPKTESIPPRPLPLAK